MDRAIWLIDGRWLTSVKPLQWSSNWRDALRMDAAEGMALLRTPLGAMPGIHLAFVHHVSHPQPDVPPRDPYYPPEYRAERRYPQW